MMVERRGRIGVNKEDDMEEEIKILKFLFVQPYKNCTYKKFKEFDNGQTHLATTLLALIRDGKVHDNEMNEIYTLTETGENALRKITKKKPPQDSEES